MVKNCTAGGNKPIILAGNKNDLPYPMETQTQKLQDVLNRFTEVETGLECSAREMHNVSELFYFAQKAVLHPTAPLYVPTSKQLKPDCASALQRVFKVRIGVEL
jgi:Ras family protein T2